MTYFLVALAIAIVGGFNPFVRLISSDPKKFVVGWLWRAGVIFPLALWYAYGSNPALTGPFWGLTMPLLFAMLLNTIFSVLTTLEKHEREDVPIGAYVFLVFAVIACGRGIAGSSLFTAEDRHKMIGTVQVSPVNDALQIDVAHIRMVSLEQAAWAANKVLGEADLSIGSRFHVGHPTLQRVGQDFVYVCPLEYNGFRHWLTKAGTPGYVLVSATDAQQPARLVTKNGETPFALKYMPTAWFGDNLTRHVYESGYASYEIWDYHLELDEASTPWWVVSLVQPTNQYSLEQVKLVLLVDPQTGEIKEHTASSLPVWVDRGMPDDLTERYLDWWGQFGKGWWNSFITKDAVSQPTSMQYLSSADGRGQIGKEIVTLVYGSDGMAYWFTGMTSVSSKDQALVSYVLVNSRSGEAREFKMTGPNEAAILTAVNSSVSNFDGWRATMPVPYHLYGEMAWVVPVISNDGIFQKLAIVRSDNSRVALGGTKQEALREFQRLRTTRGNEISPSESAVLTTVTVRVDRVYGDVQNGTTVYHLWSSQAPDRIYTATSQVSPQIPILQSGDLVEVRFMETSEQVVPITSITVKSRRE
jgi:hypothetical protein